MKIILYNKKTIDPSKNIFIIIIIIIIIIIVLFLININRTINSKDHTYTKFSIIIRHTTGSFNQNN